MSKSFTEEYIIYSVIDGEKYYNIEIDMSYFSINELKMFNILLKYSDKIKPLQVFSQDILFDDDELTINIDDNILIKFTSIGYKNIKYSITNNTSNGGNLKMSRFNINYLYSS